MTQSAARNVAIVAVVVSSLAACSSGASGNRPDVEMTIRPESTDFSGLVEGDYYLPLSDGVDPASKPVLPGVRYVNVPDYTGPLPFGGMDAVDAALGQTMAGFTCPVRGRVLASAMIDATGKAVSPRIVGSIHPECDERAFRAFTSLRFTPATVAGQPVAMPLTLPITFQ